MPQSVEDSSGDTAGDGADTGAPAPGGSGTGRRRRAPEGAADSGQVRGGHPQDSEGKAPGPERYGAWQGVQPRPRVPGPRKEFVEAFKELPGAGAGPDTGSAAPAAPAANSGADGSPAGGRQSAGGNGDGADDSADGGADGSKGGKGRTFTGIAAAAVTTVLAVVVAGQVVGGGGGHSGPQAAGAVNRETGAGAVSRGDNRVTPKAAPVPLTYMQKMSKLYPLAPKLKASGDFSVVPGSAVAPGHGHKYRYRVDIEKGMGLDGTLFADAVQKTLNDKRSWAHNGAKTFERVSSGDPDFVITLASPVTTAHWCAKSGLDTLEENVSCDSAATDRVMINAYRWAQGSTTYGDSKIYPYRQMLINHEVGHRLGHNHVSCRTPGALAPVMQQQTKSLDIDGIKCRANPWVYPTG